MTTFMCAYFGLLAAFAIVYAVRLELVFKARKAYWDSDRWVLYRPILPCTYISFDAQFYDLTTWRPSTIQAQLHKSITGEDA